jgi:hypothetical protein
LLGNTVKFLVASSENSYMILAFSKALPCMSYSEYLYLPNKLAGS